MSCRIAQADGRIQIKPVDKGGGMAVMNIKDWICISILSWQTILFCSLSNRFLRFVLPDSYSSLLVAWSFYSSTKGGRWEMKTNLLVNLSVYFRVSDRTEPIGSIEKIFKVGGVRRLSYTYSIHSVKLTGVSLGFTLMGPNIAKNGIMRWDRFPLSQITFT